VGLVTSTGNCKGVTLLEPDRVRLQLALTDLTADTPLLPCCNEACVPAAPVDDVVAVQEVQAARDRQRHVPPLVVPAVLVRAGQPVPPERLPQVAALMEGKIVRLWVLGVEVRVGVGSGSAQQLRSQDAVSLRPIFWLCAASESSGCLGSPYRVHDT